MRFPVDLGSVLIDGRQHWFVAHVVARRSWWRGRVVAVMNAQWLGTWDLGPKSHPNDGLLDVSDGRLSFGDRLKARRRLTTGSHLPHPDIAVRRTSHEQFTFDPPLDIYVDGEKVARARTVSVRVEPDALEVVI
jgi:diacylglycerol kinase family enzyme